MATSSARFSACGRDAFVARIFASHHRTIRAVAAALAACSLLVCSPAAAQPLAGPAGHSRVRVIEADYGGSLAVYMHDVDSLRAAHGRVEIRGDCRSACTLFLGVGDVCVDPRATLRFHGPSRPGQPLTPAQFDAFSRKMAGYYPAAVRSWFLGRARYETRKTITLRGRDLIRMGVPAC